MISSTVLSLKSKMLEIMSFSFSFRTPFSCSGVHHHQDLFLGHGLFSVARVNAEQTQDAIRGGGQKGTTGWNTAATPESTP